MEAVRGYGSIQKRVLDVSGEGAKPSAVGQVAMATDHGGRRGAPTGASGQSRVGGTWRSEGSGQERPSAGLDASLGGGRAREGESAAPWGR